MGKGLNAAVVAICLVVRPAAAEAPATYPRVADARLELKLVASDPDVVTPVGIDVDRHGRLFVLESHTHSPPRDYRGPKSDRIKVLRPPGADGRSSVEGVFADGIEDGMGLSFSPAGDLYVVTSQSVLRLSDSDGDGVADARTTVLRLVTAQRPYEHAALLGITFSHDGWMYVSRGNVGSLRYTIKSAADGSAVSGYGDGGNVVRCRPDGSALEEVATGFWNPFGLAFDRAGRLLCVDNDPDARGPNRLVHVIPGGDYGYKSMFGGGGNHPFQSWNGELPGTLPFVAGLGEAPCGVLDASLAALPDDYRDVALCTVWGEHNITRARLKPRGVSVTAETDVPVEGDQDFRPVAIAAGGDGAVYFTDWVKRDYPNHGHGRVWRLSARAGVATPKPRSRWDDPPLPTTPAAPVADPRAALAHADPFVRAAAVAELSAPRHRDVVLASLDDDNPDVRLGALLALRRARPDAETAAPQVRRLLRDADPRVRRMALVWAGEGAMEAVRGGITHAVARSGVTAELFETYLAATECLSPEFVAAMRSGKEPYANRLPRKLDPAVVESFVADASAPAALRALALTRLERPANHVATLQLLLKESDDSLRLEAVRTLAAAEGLPAAALLRAAKDPDLPPDVRAEAVLALSSQPPAEAAGSLLPLLDDVHETVKVEVVRSLRGAAAADGRVARVLAQRLRTIERHGHDAEPRFTEQLRFALRQPGVDPAAAATAGPAAPHRPTSVDAWEAALADRPSDPASGRRMFFSARVGCAHCHTVHNRGGKLGPDLSRIASSRDRRKLLHAILRPSDEFSIDYQAWYVKTKDGNTHLGLQLDLKDRGDIELFTTEGKTTHFASKDIAAYGALKQSLMPDGLEAGMSVGDFRDLLTFLESLR